MPSVWFELINVSGCLILFTVNLLCLITLMSDFVIDIAVTKFCRPYLLTYVADSTDYINAVFADVSVWIRAIVGNSLPFVF